jgi:ComF family protein
MFPARVDYYRRIIHWLTELVWPTRCLSCRTYGAALCAACMASMPRRTHQECIVCKHPTPQGAPCGRCTTHTLVDRLLIAGPIDHPLIHTAIHTLKYRHSMMLAEPLADWLVGTLALRQATREPFYANPLLIPVPLHPHRHHERGFNQSELLARRAASIIAMPYSSDTLRRIRHTASQVKTQSRWERIDNMKGAFACQRPDIVRDRDIVLIDDVCTTGATLDACAHALKDAGARSVTAVVLARG